VTKGQRLVGIITRSDIIRAEVEELHETRSFNPPLEQRVIGEPSYAIYQTRSPAVGKSRILVPIANSDTAIHLTEFASAIAQFRQAELELLHLIKVPRNTLPNQVWVNPTFGRELLQHTESIARQQQIPVHTELRTTHNRSDAILEIIQERQISLLIMGWQGRKNLFATGLLGTVAEKLVRRAPCDVILIKPGKNAKRGLSLTGRWLIPVTMHEAQVNHLLELLPQFTKEETTPDYLLCDMGEELRASHPSLSLEAIAQRITEQLEVPVETVSLTTTYRENGVLQLAQEKACDVIVLWTPLRQTSQEPSFNQNFVTMIANRFPGTVIFIRPTRA
jgi:CIC family chloride channel protein